MSDSNNNIVINDQVASILGISNIATPNVPAVANVPAPLPPLLFRQPTPPVPVRNDQPTQAENDAEYARDNLYDVIQKTNTLIDEMIPVASQSQAPRAYEVLNSLLNTQKETAALLLKLQSDRAKLKTTNGSSPTTIGSPTGNVHIANAIFVGTSSQLLDLMKGRNRKEEETIRDAEFLVDDEE